jgi:transcriptional regulator with XRE-family HTH domain
MEFKDLSARFKQQREAAQPVAPAALIDPDESFRIRARMIGVLLRDARASAGRSIDDCARLLHVSVDEVERWEYGEAAPSLPQLELLAHYLNVPVSHFWGTTTIEATARDTARIQEAYLALRDRMIGALLRQAREDLGMSLGEIGEAAGLPAERIEAYELGELPLPMHELTVLAHAVRKNLDYFLESGSHIGELLALRELWKDFSALPEDLREFVANPLNIGFIEIAYMLSQMPVDRLRRIGESILNITM